jgi:uncharacterized Zn finger protein (UPF0148 family)
MTEHVASKQEARKQRFDAFIRNTVFGGKKWVEGYCEDCGNFDLLEYRNGRYLCSVCAERVEAQEENHE